MRFLHVAYHDFEGIADNVDERERLVNDLGDHEAMILRNHGLLVVGRTVPSAFTCCGGWSAPARCRSWRLSCNTKLTYPPPKRARSGFRQGEATGRTGRPGTATSPGPRTCVNSTVSIRPIGIEVSGKLDRARTNFGRGLPCNLIAHTVAKSPMLYRR